MIEPKRVKSTTRLVTLERINEEGNEMNGDALKEKGEDRYS